MPGWSVAISGGGHRAGLFGLGALQYLADAGLNAEVTSIASVSGGSLTNGYLGAHLDYPTLDGEKFDKAVAPLVKRCAVQGTVEWAPEAVALLVGIGLGVVVAIGCWFLPVAGWLRLVLCLLGLALALGLLEARSVVADRIFRRQLFSTSDGRTIRLTDLKSSVTHVLCATEVQSKVHAYFSRAFAYSYEFGTSTGAGRLPLSTAVQASACFPGGFPPRSLSASKLGFTTPHRKTLWLVDGGVYDNMGEQWAQRFTERMKQTPELAAVAGPAPDNLLVVNASAREGWSTAPWLMRVPLLGELLTLLREKGILYQVGTTNRRYGLVRQFDTVRLGMALPDGPQRTALLTSAGLNGALTNIATDPWWPSTATLPSPSEQAACAEVAAALTAFADRNWITEASTLANKVPTTLAKVGRDRAAALLWLGYVLTMTNLHVFFDAPLLQVPTRQRFEALCD
ncbi:MAG: patatin-like phospholipase family protein [Actinobacteria bacterium]|nr:patatin-like phospholipase family protein [Actinomycetota bacterium]